MAYGADWDRTSRVPVSVIVDPADAEYPDAILVISTMLWSPKHYPPGNRDQQRSDIDRAFSAVAGGDVGEALSFPWVERVYLRAERRCIPPSVRRDVLSSGECTVCGKGDELEVDHIHPVSRGGTSQRPNLQALCKDCNRDKRGRTMEEWLYG